jgi:hypothetical protein
MAGSCHGTDQACTATLSRLGPRVGSGQDDLCAGFDGRRLVLAALPWAEFRSPKAEVNLHSQLDLCGPIPVDIELRAVGSHDVLCHDTLIFEAGAFYLLGRA